MAKPLPNTELLAGAQQFLAAPSQPSLVEAVNMVYRAASTRIATLQAEIDALRKAMQPFAQVAKFPHWTPSSSVEDGDPLMKELISIAQRLPNGQ